MFHYRPFVGPISGKPFSRSQVPLGNTVLTALRSVIHQSTLLYSQESAPIIVCKQGQSVSDSVGWKIGGLIFVELATTVFPYSCFYSYKPRRGQDCIPKWHLGTRKTRKTRKMLLRLTKTFRSASWF